MRRGEETREPALAPPDIFPGTHHLVPVSGLSAEFNHQLHFIKGLYYGLSRNCSHRLMCVSPWSPAGGAV